jgi:chromatin segregation and condensation protein Rec8/ScpA/Scc1 (kleisin family)
LVSYFLTNMFLFNRDKYYNHKKPQRPDVTKIKSPDEPMAKIAKLAKEKRRERGDGDTDHIAEITQLKEKIASLQKTITAKNSELVSKQVTPAFKIEYLFID